MNESVFRYLFIKNLPKDIHSEDEWHRVDLLLHRKNEFFPIEFKFYDSRPCVNFTKKRHHYKGGAGDRNFMEFVTSIQKLMTLSTRMETIDPVVSKSIANTYTILVSIDHLSNKRKHFNEYYSENVTHSMTKRLRKYRIQYETVARIDKTIGDNIFVGFVLRILEKSMDKR